MVSSTRTSICMVVAAGGFADSLVNDFVLAYFSFSFKALDCIRESSSDRVSLMPLFAFSLMDVSDQSS